MKQNNLKEETLRASLYQFIGSVLNSYSEPEQAIAIILEELTKVIAKDEELKEFDTELIRPILKSCQYIISTRYDKLLKDSNEAFPQGIPNPVKIRLENTKHMLDLLNIYIKQL